MILHAFPNVFTQIPILHMIYLMISSFSRCFFQHDIQRDIRGVPELHGIHVCYLGSLQI